MIFRNTKMKNKYNSRRAIAACCFRFTLMYDRGVSKSGRSFFYHPEKVTRKVDVAMYSFRQAEKWMYAS